jgi:integrase
MSIYSVKGKGFRYDFTLKGERYTEAWFKTKKAAQAAEAKRKEELKNPKLESEGMPTDITFLELVNLRLDHVKAYNADSHYETYVYMARGWMKRWGSLSCSGVTQRMIQEFVLERSRVSSYTANRELRYLRATFNFGLRRLLIVDNPTSGIDFLPAERKIRYVPPVDDIKKVLAAAEQDIRDYLLIMWHMMARVGEINQLVWDDVNFDQRTVVLWTRKKKGGHRTPRKVPMTQEVFDVLSRRYELGGQRKPWVFYASYTDPVTCELQEGPYSQYRRTVLTTLCEKVNVRHFTFHALRHSGASVLDNNNVPIGTIQKLLGHENRTTTEIYLHTLGNAEKEAIAVFERAMDSVGNSHTESHTAV